LSATLDRVLDERGRAEQLDAFVVAAAWDRAGAVAAFALGDGGLRLSGRDATVAAHDGAVLALAAHPKSGFVSGGDDGKLALTGLDGATRTLASHGMRWVEQVASYADTKAGVIACAVGKRVFVLDAAGEVLKTLEHPSSVTGLAFDAKGKRLAASHYNGASLWFVASKTDNPRKLDWKGSHTGIAISPDGDNVVTAMQENALHGWRLSDGQHMRMSGYPAKTASHGFTRSGRWLASAGAESIVLWPFFGGGPMGKAPSEVGGGDPEVLCTAVACHPLQETVAAGFSDGTLILADIASGRILPVCGPGRGSVSALAWSLDGAWLAAGTETGFAAVIDFSQR